MEHTHSNTIRTTVFLESFFLNAYQLHSTLPLFAQLFIVRQEGCKIKCRHEPYAFITVKNQSAVTF